MPGPKRVVVDPTEAAYWKEVEKVKVLRHGVEAALWLLGNDADRASIGDKPWAPLSAVAVPGILRAALKAARRPS